MARRSMAGAGLLAVAGVLLATGPTERHDAASTPLATQALVTADVVPQASRSLPQKAVASTPAEKPPAMNPAPPDPAAAPPAPLRMINGPQAKAPTVPVQGPKNGDVPPVTREAVPVVTSKPLPQAIPAVATQASTTATPTAPARHQASVKERRKPVREVVVARTERPAPSRPRSIISADASPAPRNSPAPRVQW